MGHGTLRIYLGAAPGVGKTYAMLAEGRRRAERGTDTVVAFVEPHGRPKTAAMLDGLEVLPRRTLVHRGASFTEMDVDAVLTRRPRLALVDELAHSNVPGSRNAKRWQDVDELLAAGIDVVTTVNVQHLESLNDVVSAITGIEQRETIPDSVVRAADQVELVDMAPEALRRRMAHGNIYGADKIDAALSNYFRVGNLTALRELALLWVADKVEEQLDRYRADHGITGTWEARERVVVALTGGPEGDTLVRRAARIAARGRGAELLAVHVTRSDGLVGADPAHLARQRALVESLGGTYHHVIGDDVPRALLDFARAENATQLVLGASRRGRLAQMLSPGIGVTTTALSGSIDVHMVTHEEIRSRGRLPRVSRGLAPRRQLLGLLVAVGLLTATTAVLAASRSSLNLTSDVMVFLLVVVTVALVGGIWPALVAAVGATALTNYYFTPPLHRWSIAERNNAVALVAFVAVAIAVSRVVDLAARRAGQAARATAEAETLSMVAGSVLRGEQALPAILGRLRESFGMSSVTLLENARADTAQSGHAGVPASSHPPRGEAESGGAGRSLPAAAGNQADTAQSGRQDGRSLPAAAGNQADTAPTGGAPGGGTATAGGDGWTVVASVGGPPCLHPTDGDVEVPAAGRFVLVLRGRAVPAADRRVLAAFAAQAAAAVEQRRLASLAAEAKPLAEADRVRTALLAAVSHDLRTPLAAAKAAVTSLRSSDISWTDAERAELVATADESLDRLTTLVENLLDMSRLQAGALSVFPREVHADDIVPLALDAVGPAGRDVRMNVPAELPPIHADPVLLERIIANLALNAARFSPRGQPPLISASALADRVEIRVIDHGPGISESDRDLVFQPFQRLGDHGRTTGIGLGLALSRGLAEAMGGSLFPEDTPGGGLTMVVVLPTSAKAGTPAAPSPQA